MRPAHATADTRRNILDVAQRIMSGKGFSAVGLNEILTSASVPKGSFYHYFESKDALGEAMLTDYFDAYLTDMDRTLGMPGESAAQRLMNYWRQWTQTQQSFDCQGKCLAVKLGAEVADLSESMRQALKTGTAEIIGRIAVAIEAGTADGSLEVEGRPDEIAQNLYQLWLGASVMVKIVRDVQPFEAALQMTRRILNLQRS
ncbi:MAG TPA: TetR/AcrR family transcriptional regulator [Dyella sp.]|uniref:TetR/AcrR family transcriptional regulator n=1 Tax=Dyella sp. TaxID=1869338 RepID=UPI002F94991C